ncbi:MAG: hypothetical protein QOE90_2414 [Thermoplasmata archaeon]|jgi:hypothetical protein|nr:hypothetical protein [Thermoplasmata archaeon]
MVSVELEPLEIQALMIAARDRLDGGGVASRLDLAALESAHEQLCLALLFANEPSDEGAAS